MTASTNIQLYENLKKKLGTSEAEALVDFVDSRLKDSNDDNTKLLATKEDVKDLKFELTQEISGLRLDIERLTTKGQAWMIRIFVALVLMLITLLLKK